MTEKTKVNDAGIRLILGLLPFITLFWLLFKTPVFSIVWSWILFIPITILYLHLVSEIRLLEIYTKFRQDWAVVKARLAGKEN